MVLLSIIIPVYNIDKYLERCLQSILTQPFTDFELILINDGSSDMSGKICDEQALKDNRIKVFHKENEGVSAARNSGLSHACGQYIVFIDGDDTIAEDTLCENMSYLLANPNVEMLEFPGFYNYGNKATEYLYKKQDTLLVTGKDNITNYWLRNPRFEIWGKFYKKKLIGDLRFDSDIAIGEDLLFLIKVISKCETYFISDKGCYYYFFNQSSAMNNKTRDRSLDEVRLINKLADVKSFPDLSILAKFVYIVLANYILNPIKGKQNKKHNKAYDDLLLKLKFNTITNLRIPVRVKVVLSVLKIIKVRQACNLANLKK